MATVTVLVLSMLPEAHWDIGWVSVQAELRAIKSFPQHHGMHPLEIPMDAEDTGNRV